MPNVPMVNANAQSDRPNRMGNVSLVMDSAELTRYFPFPSSAMPVLGLCEWAVYATDPGTRSPSPITLFSSSVLFAVLFPSNV